MLHHIGIHLSYQEWQTLLLNLKKQITMSWAAYGEGQVKQNCEWLLGNEGGLQVTASKKPGFFIHAIAEKWIPWKSLYGLGNRFIPRQLSRWDAGHVTTLSAGMWDSEQRVQLYCAWSVRWQTETWCMCTTLSQEVCSKLLLWVETNKST
jgi:hypothetical protein